MTKTTTWTTRGILNAKAGEAKFTLSRHSPTSSDIAFFVDRYWIIDWDLTDSEPYLQETLPYPCVHLVIEPDNTLIYGVDTGKFARLVQNRGRVFGIKFRPGAFYPFMQSSISALTNRTLPPEQVFDVDGRTLEAAVLPLKEQVQMIARVEQFLQQHLPMLDPNVTLINQIVDCIIDNRSVTRVEDIALQMALSKRSLQRLFQQYVGVSPKWVIQRYRLQEAAEQLAADVTGGIATDQVTLAQQLGYFDQAHFIKDFKLIVGSTPAEYARKIAQSIAHSQIAQSLKPDN
ncbi:MAG TPA: AraC family transcriptional regulator [Phototrophicaceae bacterium]|jgi:AraC-like DNA-binding protein|nr:AraC family transcriptional regulator [Phototrophicaceae bacterium]